jgi:hypothetical protein
MSQDRMADKPPMTEAAWRTVCEACDEWIVPGDFIVREDGEWIHQSCADPDLWEHLAL